MTTTALALRPGTKDVKDGTDCEDPGTDFNFVLFSPRLETQAKLQQGTLESRSIFQTTHCVKGQLIKDKNKQMSEMIFAIILPG